MNRQERERLKESEHRVVTRKRRPGELMVHSRNDHHGFKNSELEGYLHTRTKTVRQYSFFPIAHNAQRQSHPNQAGSDRRQVFPGSNAHLPPRGCRNSEVKPAVRPDARMVALSASKATRSLIPDTLSRLSGGSTPLNKLGNHALGSTSRCAGATSREREREREVLTWLGGTQRGHVACESLTVMLYNLYVYYVFITCTCALCGGS